MRDLIENYFEKLKTSVDALDRGKIEQLVKVLVDARDGDKTIFVMGNGGSAATASHFVCDIAKAASYPKEKRFKVVSLNDNIPIMMAYANDVGYDDIFVEQLKNQFQKGDVVLGLSGSGNSKNVLKAIDYANQNGGVTVGFTGYDGGELKNITSLSLDANINDMQVTEDIHMILVHVLMRALSGLGD